jgi:LysR family cys regulon transcriptional activator
MNLQQLRFVREAVRQNFNLTEAAKALFTSQPGVSKAIIELEEELGVEIFRRHGKRIRGLTEPGRVILRSIETVMQEVDSLRRIGKEFAAQDSGSLTIATTHTLARYYLPRILPGFMQRFPKVRLSLLQGSPKQIVEMLLRDQADIAVATEAVEENDGLVTLPCYQWEHYLVVQPSHPLAKSRMITLEEIAQYPIITYDSAFTGRAKIDQAFALRGLKPDILLEAIDADVIKTYVELGMGVGIIAGMAFDTERDKNLQPIPVGHLFGTSVSRLLIKRNMYLRSYVYAFTELLSPALNRKMIEKAMSADGGNYEL